MLKAQRQDMILDMLGKHSSMMVSTLAELLQCSRMTVRRDIEELEALSLVKKVHGGVVLNKGNDPQPSHFLRISSNIEEKQIIGAKAATLIHNGECVFFDGGTTTFYIAKNLPASLSFTAITNSLKTATELCKKPNVNVIMLGGEIHSSSYSSINNIAIDTVRRFHADIAFISTKAIILPEGLFETTLSLIEIKQVMVENASKVILVADHTKFADRALCLSVPLQSLDHVITDRLTPRDCLAQLDAQNIPYTVV